MNTQHLMPKSDARHTAHQIIEAVCDRWDFSTEELYGKCRTQPLAFARQVAMTLIYENTSLSLVDIGTMFGGRDHSTVSYARDVVNKTRKGCKKMDALICEIEWKIISIPTLHSNED
jgi:chromosomal replication initiator protein